MKKILGIILGLFILGLAILFGVASQRPREYTVERSVTSAASAESIFAVMSDLKRFPEWNPYQKHDPETKGSWNEVQGVGQVYSYESQKMGSGRMTIVRLEPNSVVELKLEFLKPFASQGVAFWEIKDEGAERRIIWRMEARNESLIPQVMGMLLDIPGMLGKDFEDGLNNVKAIAEKAQS